MMVRNYTDEKLSYKYVITLFHDARFYTELTIDNVSSHAKYQIFLFKFYVRPTILTHP